MDREISFYYLVTGLVLQFLIMVYYYLILFPATLSKTLIEGQLAFFIFVMTILSSIAAILIGIGNKNSKVFPNRILNAVLFIPVPLTIVGLAMFAR